MVSGDYQMVGDKILIIRTSDDFSEAELALFRAELDAMIARHGLALRTVMVPAAAPQVAEPSLLTIRPEASGDTS